MKMPSTNHLEAVYGFALQLLSKKVGLRRKLTLRVLTTLEVGPKYFNFDREDGVLSTSEDMFHGPSDVPVYHLARLVLNEAYADGETQESSFQIDCAEVAAEIEHYEQDLIIRAAAYAKYAPVRRLDAERADEGEICTEDEAKAILKGEGEITWPQTIFLPPGAGRGSVTYQWLEGAEFMIRTESTLSLDEDGKHRFTDTEYRKIKRA